MGAVVLMVAAWAAVARRPGWLLGLVGLPVLVEAVHYLLPGLGRACSVPDLLHAWLGLGAGLAAGVLFLAAPMGFLFSRTNLTDGLLTFFFTATVLAGREAEPVRDDGERRRLHVGAR